MRCRHTVLAFPSGEGGPAGPDEGQAPATAHSRQTAGGGVPDAPRNLALPPYSPCLPPRGKVAPQGRMRGRLPPAAHSRATRRGRRPRRPAEACADVLPRVTTRGDSRCRQHSRRGQDPSLRTEPLTPAHATLRAGHARPLPRNNPTHLYTT